MNHPQKKKNFFRSPDSRLSGTFLTYAQPNSSVRGVADLRGCCFDPQLGQYSVRELMIVIATGFIPLSPLSVVSFFFFFWGGGGKQPVAWTE